MNARPALTAVRLWVRLEITATLPRPTEVTVPSQRSVVLNVALRPLAGAAYAAPPTVRKTPLPVVTSERPTVPFGGPLRRHAASAPGALVSSARGGIFFLRGPLRKRACRIAKMPAR